MSQSLRLALAGVGVLACAFTVAGLRTPPAQGASPARPNVSAVVPRRYELQDVGGTPYLLDTATGRVWYQRVYFSATPSPVDGVLISNGQTVHTPAPRRAWVEDSPTWARPE